MDLIHKPPVVSLKPSCFGFPDRLLTKLRYSDFISLTSTAGAVASHVFRWNSTFDPDFTGTGHQPLYRDTYAALYDNYSVVSARAILRFVTAEDSSPLFISLNTDDDTTVSTNKSTLAEQSHGYSSLLTPLAGSQSFKEIVANWDCKTILGIDPFASETYKTAVGSNPANESCLAISCATTDGGDATINFQIILEQSILWTELSTPTQS